MGRIITVGTYLMGIGNEYERFVFEVRRQAGASPYVFEAIALHGSSLVLNLVLCALGFLLPERATGSPLGWYPKVLQAYIYMGLIGLGITILLFILYDNRRKSVNILADKFFSTRIPRIDVT
jgi:putative flippase GtrA